MQSTLANDYMHTSIFREKTITFFASSLNCLWHLCWFPWELRGALGSVLGRGNYAVQGICQGVELGKIKGDVMVAGSQPWFWAKTHYHFFNWVWKLESCDVVTTYYQAGHILLIGKEWAWGLTLKTKNENHQIWMAVH